MVNLIPISSACGWDQGFHSLAPEQNSSSLLPGESKTLNFATCLSERCNSTVVGQNPCGDAVPPWRGHHVGPSVLPHYPHGRPMGGRGPVCKQPYFKGNVTGERCGKQDRKSWR